MKVPALIVLAGLAGLTVSVRALQTDRDAAGAAIQATYYANGQLETECEVREGRREGACQRFYADGTKQAEGAYQGGRMEGRWSFWRPDGSLDPERSGSYEGGVRVAP